MLRSLGWCHVYGWCLGEYYRHNYRAFFCHKIVEATELEHARPGYLHSVVNTSVEQVS